MRRDWETWGGGLDFTLRAMESHKRILSRRESQGNKSFGKIPLVAVWTDKVAEYGKK